MPVFNFLKRRAWPFYQDRIVRLLQSKKRLFIDWFDTSPAENYITVDISDRVKDEKYILTLQRVRGKTPSEIMSIQDQDIVRYRNALREIGELAWDVRDPEQARVRVQQISDIAGIADE